MSDLGLVCVAAGHGLRFGGDKLAERLGSRTVLETACDSLRRAFPGAPLVVVLPADRIDRWAALLKAAVPGLGLVSGGARRQDSVANGVEHVAALGAEVVAVHDAARPLVHVDDVRAAVAAVEGADGALLCAPVTDTVKRVAADGLVLETVPRDRLRRAQTPQVFRIAALRRAWGAVEREAEWTDEAAILEAAGLTVRTVLATHPNPKLTTPADLLLLRALAKDTA